VSRPDIENEVRGSFHPGALGAADWLSLAATPTFAAMALLTAMRGGGPADLLCSAAHASALGGMVAMYLLMSAFHLAPWLRLIAKLPAKPASPAQGRL
jgi:hypothetical protein